MAAVPSARLGTPSSGRPNGDGLIPQPDSARRLSARPGCGVDAAFAAVGPPRVPLRAPLERYSDTALVELVRRGDQRAFDEIVERYRTPLLAHCRGIVGDAAAQDAIQQTLMSAWYALRRGQDVRHVRAWLFTIAHRAALETLRNQGTPTEELPEALAGGPSPQELIEQSARARATLAAVAELPRHERDALVWTSLHGRSGHETAQVLGVSRAAARQIVVRARARVRAAVSVFLAPVLAPRFVALRGLRRFAGVANVGSAQGSEALLARALAAGVLLAAPVAAVHLHVMPPHQLVRRVPSAEPRGAARDRPATAQHARAVQAAVQKTQRAAAIKAPAGRDSGRGPSRAAAGRDGASRDRAPMTRSHDVTQASRREAERGLANPATGANAPGRAARLPGLPRTTVPLASLPAIATRDETVVTNVSEPAGSVTGAAGRVSGGLASAAEMAQRAAERVRVPQLSLPQGSALP